MNTSAKSVHFDDNCLQGLHWDELDEDISEAGSPAGKLIGGHLVIFAFVALATRDKKASNPRGKSP